MADSTAGASTAAPAEDPGLKDLTRQQKRAEARKATAEAQRAELSALLPTIPTEFPMDVMSLPDSGSPLSTMAAHMALDACASEVANRVLQAADRSGRIWIVFEEKLTRSQAAHQAIERSLRRLGKMLGEASSLLLTASATLSSSEPEEAVQAEEDRNGAHDSSSGQPEGAPANVAFLPPLAAGATFGISLIGPLLNLLKTETTVRNTDVTINQVALAAAVARHLRQDAPGLQISIDGVAPPPAGPLGERVLAVLEQRDRLAIELAHFKAASVRESDPDLSRHLASEAAAKAVLDAHIEAVKGTDVDEKLVGALTTATENVARRRQALDKRQMVADAANVAIEQTDGFLSQLDTAGADGTTVLQLASNYEQFTDDATDFVLRVDVPFAGGESTDINKIITDDFSIHLGTASVSFLLLDRAGELLTSGTVMQAQHGRLPKESTDIDWKGLS